MTSAPRSRPLRDGLLLLLGAVLLALQVALTYFLELDLTQS